MQNPDDFNDQDVAKFVGALESTLDSAEEESTLKPLVPVKCIDCENIRRRNFCAVKGIKVSRKKPHTCEFFDLREDKSPPPDRYVPADAKEKAKKTRRFMRQLMEAGAKFTEDGHLVFDDFKIDADGTLYQKQSVEIPKTTATASVVGMEPTEAPQLSDNRDKNEPSE